MRRIKTKNLLLLVVVSLLTIGVVSALDFATLDLDQRVKELPIGGTVDFTVYLDVTTIGDNNPDQRTISWQIPGGYPIEAKLDSESYAKSGHMHFVPPSSSEWSKTFTLAVKTTNGAEAGKAYPITISYCEGGGSCFGETAVAKTTAGVIPTPELSTSVLTAIGLVGLIGLVKLRRKD